MGQTAKLRLEVDSRGEHLTLVRSVLRAFADALELDPELLGDIQTAVSEACNNIVLHAYDDHSGPMLVSLDGGPTRIDVKVEDCGEGLHAVSAARRSIGIGLPVIAALADDTKLGAADGGGTVVQMTFERRGTAGSQPPELMRLTRG